MVPSLIQLCVFNAACRTEAANLIVRMYQGDNGRGKGNTCWAVGRKSGEPIYPTLKNISCFQCHSEFDGPACYNASQYNVSFRTCSQSIAKGGGCAVYRLDTSEQSVGVRTHSIERRCADSCQPDCVIVGERHKLHLCTSCCNQTLCNVDNAARPRGRRTLALRAFGVRIHTGYPAILGLFVLVTAVDRLVHSLLDV
ncbi:hypothetical protein BIW11_10575 [Tropilaelaps mercedesae]|uniref:Uncharacterized protein n=1 Tax=Tropilaelaps mercedesae TaxID=418985 RepID=A0A1V9XF19_9ACAR|nr:hypothetical protein BIW11_10575 [Tropilaelaps mercedesae]